MAGKTEKPAAHYTKYEIARMVGARALQIAMGAPFMLKLNDGQLAGMGYNPVEIAKLELNEGVLPMAVRRPTPRLKLEEEQKLAEEAAKAAAKPEAK